jgi:hypothetical protein
MLPSLLDMLKELPEEEQPFAELYLRHVVNILRHMPESQRFIEYAKAELSVAHHASLHERGSAADREAQTAHAPDQSGSMPLRALPSRGNSR